jgi:hypothetical protein
MALSVEIQSASEVHGHGCCQSGRSFRSAQHIRTTFTKTGHLRKNTLDFVLVVV